MMLRCHMHLHFVITHQKWTILAGTDAGNWVAFPSADWIVAVQQQRRMVIHFDTMSLALGGPWTNHQSRRYRWYLKSSWRLLFERAVEFVVGYLTFEFSFSLIFFSSIWEPFASCVFFFIFFIFLQISLCDFQSWLFYFFRFNYVNHT